MTTLDGNRLCRLSNSKVLSLTYPRVSDLQRFWLKTDRALLYTSINFSSKSIFQLSYLLGGWSLNKGSPSFCTFYWNLSNFNRFPLKRLQFPNKQFKFLDLYHRYAVHAGFKYVFPSLYASILFNLKLCLKQLCHYGISLCVCVYFPTFEMKVDSKVFFYWKGIQLFTV